MQTLAVVEDLDELEYLATPLDLIYLWLDQVGQGQVAQIDTQPLLTNASTQRSE